MTAAVLVSAVLSAYQAGSTDMVRQQERARAEALRLGDVGALGRVLAADYREVDVFGRVHPRAEALAIRPDLPATERMTITMHDQVATVIGREGDARILRVWIQDAGTWRLVAHQATRIQPGVPPSPPTPELLATPRVVRMGTEDPVAREVLAAQDALDLANALNDVTAFRQLTAPDFVLVTNQGLTRTKADRLVEERIRQLSEGPRRPLGERDDVHVGVYGSTAIVSARSWPLTVDGHPAPPTRFTRVWVKGASGWQQLANIVTPVTTPS
jgi:hypothetical protein